MSSIIDVQWRSGRDTVGIVLIKTELDQYKAYIGFAEGFNDKQDANYIAAWGAKLSLVEAQAFFPSWNLTQTNYVER